MWHEERLFNVTVLQRVHLSNIVSVLVLLYFLNIVTEFIIYLVC
jgi:hypothetical protein